MFRYSFESLHCSSSFQCSTIHLQKFQAFFTPLGETGFNIWIVKINMYTSAAYLMAFICVLAAVLMLVFFQEDYAGIIDKNSSDEKCKFWWEKKLQKNIKISVSKISVKSKFFKLILLLYFPIFVKSCSNLPCQSSEKVLKVDLM